MLWLSIVLPKAPYINQNRHTGLTFNLQEYMQIYNMKLIRSMLFTEVKSQAIINMQEDADNKVN